MDLAAPEGPPLATARRLFDRFARGGWEALGDVLDPCCEYTPSYANGVTLCGPEAIREWSARRREEGLELEARALDFEVRGNWVLVRGYLRGRENRVLAESQHYWVCQVRDDRIVSMAAFARRDAALGAIAVAA